MATATNLRNILYNFPEYNNCLARQNLQRKLGYFISELWLAFLAAPANFEVQQIAKFLAVKAITIL